MVYKIPRLCVKTYIRQTSRPLLVSIFEHRKTVTNREEYGSNKGKHVCDMGNTIQWKESVIFYKDPNWKKLNLTE